MIRLENVTKTYGGRPAVQDLSLEIAPGEFFAFLGPNGAGKTTTVKMIVGLLRPTRGRVTVCDYDVQKDDIAARRVLGYVPDQPFLYDKLSGREFLNLIGEMYGLNGPERRREIDRLSGELGMADYLDQLTESYSHGMKQRAVLAATLLHHPRAIVLDEPLVGLDPHTSRRVQEILREQARAGTTLFMSTHVISIAESVAHRIGIIRDGRLIAVGSHEELGRRAGITGTLEEVYFRITEGPDGSPDRAPGESRP